LLFGRRQKTQADSENGLRGLTAKPLD